MNRDRKMDITGSGEIIVGLKATGTKYFSLICTLGIEKAVKKPSQIFIALNIKRAKATSILCLSNKALEFVHDKLSERDTDTHPLLELTQHDEQESGFYCSGIVDHFFQYAVTLPASAELSEMTLVIASEKEDCEADVVLWIK